ncbi:MAG: ABC transporter substrate-binding protein, partial [Cyclobacteriaceae bacterium]|nr:ABC transporter substrate-binding protein [Cyclobacteriaceae bacterium]
MRNTLLIVILFFAFQIANAQTAPPEGFQKAKTALQEKDYWTAINGFKGFLDQEKFGSLTNYAAFYAAEAALAVNQPAQARDFLQPIYPNRWKYQEESKYLLALAYFRNDEDLEALRVIESIQNENVKSKAFNASFEFLRDQSPNFFVSNLAEFKSNEGFSAALSEVFQKKSILSASEQLILKEIQEASPRHLVQDEVLDLSVILPFTSGSAASINPDFNYELYQGIELAVEELKSQGNQINLNAYDSKRDLAVLSSILKTKEILDSDVLIGPIYPDEADLVSGFAQANKIPFVHPLSNLGDRFGENEYSYLFRPSVNSISKGILDALKKQNWGKTVAIAYSGSTRDENLSKALQEDLTQNGFQIKKNERVDPRSVTTFFQNLGVRREDSVKVHQIILLTDDPAIAQPTFALIESITTSVPILVMDSWVGFNFANYEMLEFPNFYFISNNTPKFFSDEMKAFRKAFYQKYLSYPTLNSILGYELAYWLSTNAKPNLGFDLRSG